MDLGVGQAALHVAATFNNIGVVYQKQGKYEEALVQHQKSFEIHIQALGQDHPD